MNTNVAPRFTFSDFSDETTITENDGFSAGFFVGDDFDFDDVTVTLGGADASFFRVFEDPFFSVRSHTIELISPLDFENPQDADGDNVYVIDIIASDGVNETIRTVEFTIEDILESENAPVFTTPDTIVLDEGQAFVVNVNADDLDGDAVTYRLVGGDDQFDFTIDSETGALSFNSFSIPEFNDNPSTFNIFDDNFYTVIVEASDGNINTTRQEITIEIIDANVAPIFLTSFFSNLDEEETLIENQSFSEFFQFTDRFDDDPVTLSLEGPDAAFFVLANLNEGSGFANARLELVDVFDFENPQDADENNVYVVDIVASDGVNRTIQTIEFTIENEFESPNAPVFTSLDTISVDEGQLFVVDVIAEDADREIITYSIVGGDDGGDFRIDSQTGELSFATTPIFTSFSDEDRDNIFNVIVEAFDGRGNRTEQQLAIELIDVDVAPVFLPAPDAEQSVEENQNFLDFFQVDDRFDRQDVSVTLEGEDAAFFELINVFDFSTAFNADLTLVAPLDFENPQDADGDNVYVVNVVATDGVNRTIQTVELTITDVFESENAPVFTTPNTLSVDEGDTFVLNVSADDADGDAISYSIIGGEDQFEFFIDGQTGELNFFNIPEFNFPFDMNGDNVYNIVVEAFDGSGNRTEQILDIEVVDANVAPMFESPIVTNRDVSENENFSDFFSVNDLIDLDEITVTLEGEDAAFFVIRDISEFTAEIFASLELVNPLDFENPQDADGDNVYVVDVVASDGVNETVQTVEVTILDDPSDNATAISISESFLALDSSFAFEAGAEALFNDIISPEFSEALLVSDVFELATLNEASELGSPTEDDFWTIKSVALDSEVVAEEVSDTESLDEAYSGIDDDVFEIAAPSDIGEDVWF